MSDVVELTQALIRRPSVTPDDGGCQSLLGERLAALGFDLHALPFGEVSNLWAQRGEGKPLFCFAGHTDVVPTGPLEQWRCDPFAGHVEDGLLYGRGAADMKGSLAAMVCALERHCRGPSSDAFSIALLLTSDEEGPAEDGTRRVIDWLADRGQKIDWCLVGEPSSDQHVGDRVRVGRRGSLNGRLIVAGRQGHVAFPQFARNPIHDAAPALTALTREHWDDGNEDFGPTTFQISNIASGTGATNVIPGELTVDFNLRFSTQLTAEAIIRRVDAIVARHDLNGHIEWRLSGQPFRSRPGKLTRAIDEAARELTGTAPRASTGGGTSDGRFIAPTGAEVVELGPPNATIHKIDEHVSLASLQRLEALYTAVLAHLAAEV